MTPELRLDEIADAILDGLPVDWSLVAALDSPDDKRLVEQLKTLETLRRINRTNAAPEPSGPWTWGHLQVLERIGRGAYGDVYRAWDARLDREVALKLLPSDAPITGSSNSTVIEEGRLLARVRHPNVVTIYGAERIDGRVGLWMEFVKGRTLEEALRGGRTFTAAEVTRLVGELCRAVAAVHAAGLLHRDIKAQNVMLDDTDRVVLMDFGTGRELTAVTDVPIAGTPLYLAPEVLSGGTATPRSDVYSIGVLLFRLLTGSYPVSGRDLGDLRRAHAAAGRTDTRLDRPQIPAALRRVVTRAIDSNPDARYSGADELAAALASTEPVPGRRRLIIAAVTAAAIVVAGAVGWNLGLRELIMPAVPAIAVLPFTNASSDPVNDDFVDGLTIEVINNLSNIDGLEVRSQTSSFYFKDRVRDLRAVKKQLNVDYVVEADVQRDGDRVRISARLVRTSEDVPLWSEKYDRTIGDVFAIQDEISLAIVNRLRLALGRGQRRYQLSPEATDLYLRGRAAVTRGGNESAKDAAPLFEQVIARAPAFAPAYAGLAEAYAEMSWSLDGLSPSEGFAGMQRAAMAALNLDPLLPEAHAAMGITHARELRWDDAKTSFELALAYGRNMSGIRSRYATTTLLPLGEAAKAEELINAALILDPLSLDVQVELGTVQLARGRYQDAIVTLQRVNDADPTRGLNMLARALMFGGRPAEAIALWERKLRPGNWELWLIPAYLKLGRRQDFDRLVSDRGDNAFRQARIHAAQGDKDKTFEALNRAIDEGVPHRVAFTLAFPEMELLRGDPRLERLKRRLNLR